MRVMKVCPSLQKKFTEPAYVGYVPVFFAMSPPSYPAWIDHQQKHFIV